MTRGTPARALRTAGTVLLAVVVLLPVASPATAVLQPTGPGAAGTAAAELVVDGEADGDGAYATIGAAVDAAAPGDTVLVRPGTYAAAVTIDESVTVVAPRGATLDGSSLAEPAIAFDLRAGSGAAPTIAGFTITGYDVGIEADNTTGDWTVRNVTVVHLRKPAMERAVAVSAVGAAGDWRVVDSTFRDNDVAVDARFTAGNWTVADSTFLHNDFGVKADHATGAWTVANSTFVGHRDGISTWYSTGDWVVRSSTFRRNREGVYTPHSKGAWLVVNSSFRSNRYNGVDASANFGNWTILDSAFLNNTVAVTATGTGGHWAIHGSAFAGSARSAVYALGAEYEGNATRNWWGTTRGRDFDDCYGNVRCTNPLTEPPVDDPAFVGRVDQETWNTTPVETVGPANATATSDGRDGSSTNVGQLVGAVFLVVLATAGILGPILYVRRYGLQ